jgi:hypothetical protein
MGLKEDLESCRDEIQGAESIANLGAVLDIPQQLKLLDDKLVADLDKFDNALDNLCEQIGLAMQNLDKKVDESRAVVDGMRNMLEMEERRRTMIGILDWLCPTDYSQQQNDHWTNRAENTGEWIFETVEFEQWEHTSTNILFCPGDPGVGKTTIAATVIRRLLKLHDIVVQATSYVFFNYKRKEEQDIAHILGALLRQLVHAKAAVPESLEGLYTDYSKRRIRPSQQELEKELSALVSSFTRWNIVIDALDECPEQIRADLLAMIKRVHIHDAVHVLMTSRPLPAIVHLVESLFETPLSLEIRATNSDSSAYLQSQLPYCSKTVRESPDFQEKIVHAIVAKVNGM